jgi:hypothetical protein
MTKPKIKATRLLVLMALCCALMVGNFLIPSTVAEAAAKKASISATKVTMPVGEMGSKVYWNISSWEISNAQKLTVKNKVKGATYQFTSSDSKVVKISKDGGYLTGLKAGSATITCTQTYKNKKTTVGKCKVTVKNSALTLNEYNENVFAVGSGGFDLTHYYSALDPLFNIAYRNPNATYTLTSDNENFSIKAIKYDASKAKDLTDNKEYQSVIEDYIGDRYFYGYQYTAAKAGTYTVTVKETYNKKTKTLGSFKVEIKDTSISESKIDLLLGNYLNVFTLLNYTKENTDYYFDIKDYDETNPDNNVLTVNITESEVYLIANKTGTAEVTLREGSEQGTVIGTVTIVVSEAPCQSITVDSDEYTAYVDDYFYISYELDPWDTTDKVTIESDNPDVLKVEFDEEMGDWSYTPLKVGEANITIKCGNQSVVSKVVVEEW